VLVLAWIANIVSFNIHNDAFTYGALLFVPILAMINLKPPTASEGVSVLLGLAWAVTVVLVGTRVAESLGLIDVKDQPLGIIEFDESYYWLPLNDLVGIDGRWPGPFGHNGYTAMMGAFLIVIAVVFWTRSSWVFLSVGTLTLLVTSGRASAGAAAAGIVLYGMFTNKGPFTRIAPLLRIIGGIVVLTAGFAVLLSGRSGLTGRQNIWPAFWDLWLTSPVVGVGSSGISTSGGITEQYGHAHSMYLDLLARNGIIAFALVVTALAIGVGITIAAALRGNPGPLALLTAYLIVALTEPRNDWLHPGTYVLMVVVAVFTAGASLQGGNTFAAGPETAARTQDIAQ
jgi:O-antigen ligase